MSRGVGSTPLNSSIWRSQWNRRTLLSVILAGDARLTTKLRREELLPLGSRIRTRLNMEYASREALTDCLGHLQRSAGNASLMTAELMSTLAEHALGNYRVLTTMAAELLAQPVGKMDIVEVKQYSDVSSTALRHEPSELFLILP